MLRLRSEEMPAGLTSFFALPPKPVLTAPRAAPSPAWREYAEVLGGIAALTGASWFVPLTYHAFGPIYLLAVMALSLRVGRGPALAAAVVSALVWNYVFMPPRMSFSVLHVDDGLMLGTYLVTALVASQLNAHIRAQQLEREELLAARQREKLLAESERLHRTLLDSVSHELKTPLAVLHASAEKLSTEDIAKRAALLAEVRAATSRLEHLVANLLNQTRLEAGALRPRLDWCDARDLIDGARRSLDNALAHHPLSLDVPAQLPLFHADASLMEQVLANLLLNAARHTPAGTAVRVTAGHQRVAPRVFITVADCGPGIPSELQARLFQKFHRGDAARAGGLGLGLSIVRGFMLAQGGDATAANRPGGGAIFTVWLPHSAPDNLPSDEL